MAAFDYIALDQNGRRHKGVMEADSARKTRQILRERFLAPISVQEASASQKNSSKSVYSKRQNNLHIGLREISVLTHQFAALVQAGLPVEQVLQALGRQSDKSRIKSMLAAVRAQVLEGRGLAESLSIFPNSFSELFRSSVSAGERSGHLGIVLEHLAHYTQNAYQTRQKIILALLYPAILTVVSILIIVFLLAYIVPDMIRVFNDAGHALPLLTRGLIVISNTIQSYGLYLLLIFFAGGMLLRNILTRPALRLSLDRRMLLLPLIGALIREYSTARFSSTLGMLQESGVPLVQALEISAAVLGNLHLRLLVEDIARKVREGTGLSRAVAQSEVFTPLLNTMAASGEASGQLGVMLVNAGAITERDLQNRIAILLGLFEPMVLLLMGGLVLLLVLAIIMPILNLNQLVQ